MAAYGVLLLGLFLSACTSAASAEGSVDDKRFLVDSDVISCTFESTDICKYSQTNSSALTWRLQEASHTTKNMPLSDHTYLYSSRVGHFLYTSSSSQIPSGSVARLTSRVLTHGYNQIWSLRFWYYMHGSFPGTLNVLVHQPGQQPSVVFSQTGDQGTRWSEGCIDMQFTSLQVQFEAVTGVMASGNCIALDDVIIHHGSCDSIHALSTNHVTTTTHMLPTTPATSTVGTVSCTFEAANICGYTQDKADKFDWSRQQGPTPSHNTGPTADHTTGHGHYMYIETSSPRKQGEHARLISPAFHTTSSHMTLSFWYNMYGHNIGKLNVYLAKAGLYLGQPVFTDATATATAIWQYACIDVPLYSGDTRVVFEGFSGQGTSVFTGDIAIDDVSLKYGKCQTTSGTTHSPVAASTHSAAVNGNWGAWTSYTGCSVTCGSRSVYSISHRSCNNPPPSQGGHYCVGGSTRYTRCHVKPCSVDGNWGSWSSYSACSVTCGHGTRSSFRHCDDPAPANGGHSCSGISSKFQSCTLASCTVNGGWSTWSSWSKCTSSCDLGQITRHRACNHPAPTAGGASCSGDKTETHECSMGPCPEWTHWVEGGCSASCGNGTIERMRQCNTGRNADCAGHSYEQVPCVGPTCIA